MSLTFFSCKMCFTTTNIFENIWQPTAVKGLSLGDFKTACFSQDSTGSYFISLKYPSWLYCLPVLGFIPVQMLPMSSVSSIDKAIQPCDVYVGALCCCCWNLPSHGGSWVNSTVPHLHMMLVATTVHLLLVHWP